LYVRNTIEPFAVKTFAASYSDSAPIEFVELSYLSPFGHVERTIEIVHIISGLSLEIPRGGVRLCDRRHGHSRQQRDHGHHQQWAPAESRIAPGNHCGADDATERGQPPTDTRKSRDEHRRRTTGK
jgi:hypothetical protein